MKIIQTIFIVTLIFLITASLSNAQSLNIGLGGGITQVLSPDYLTNKVSEDGLGYSTEWNIGAMGKLDLPLIPITPRAFLLYHMFSGKGTNASSQDIENSQSIFEYGVGAQYNFIPVPLGFNPYIALDLSFSNFGDFTQKVDGVETKYGGVTRFGGGRGLGSEVTIVPLVNLDVYLCYKIFNLTGKDEGEDTISAATLDVFVNFNL
ncbi:MAG: outer membrane beta-barrel protein [Ignavibacteriaceae bacterium]